MPPEADTFAALRTWANANKATDDLAPQVLQVLAEQGELREQLARQDAIIGALIAENRQLKAALKTLTDWHERDCSVGGCEVAFDEVVEILGKADEPPVNNTPETCGPMAHTTIHAGPTIPDYSRPPSLTLPAVVQMPGQMGAPDGLPMGDPAPESLTEEEIRVRQQEQQAHN